MYFSLEESKISDNNEKSSEKIGESTTRRRRQVIAGVVFSQRVGPFLITALVVMLIFSCFRIGLLIGSWKYLGNSSAGDIAISLLQGVRYDLVPLSIILLPVALCLSVAPSGWFIRKTFSRLVLLYAAIASTVVITVETIGAAFFCHFTNRLDSKAVDYIEYYQDVIGHVVHSYPVWLLAVIPTVFVAGSYLGLRTAYRHSRAPAGRRWSRPAHTLIMVGLCVLCLFAAPRSAYFSSNRLLVQLSMNNMSSFVESFSSSYIDPWNETNYFTFPTESDAIANSRELLHQNTDTSYNTDLWRRTDSCNPMRTDLNVVVIVMESMSGSPVGALGSEVSYTPRLDEICKKGLFLDRMYGAGSRTNHGLVGILCSHPDMGTTILKRDELIGSYYTLPSLFKDRGYKTMFFYGADPNFDNMQNFFLKNGMDEIVKRSTMNGDIGAWVTGFHDEAVFDKAHERFMSMSTDQADQPFFAVILTLSNHDPWMVPAGKVPLQDIPETDPPDVAQKKRMQNAYRYADWALGRFFQKAEEANAPYLNNTLFVLVADHRQQLEADRTKMVDFPGFRVPCVFYAPRLDDLIKPQTISTVCSQTDIAPTLMGLLGGSFDHAFMGRDILSIADEGFALLRDGKPLAYIRGNKAVILPPKGRPWLYEVGKSSMREIGSGGKNSEITKSLESEMMSYYGAARYLLKRRGFARPDFINVDAP